MKVLAAWSLWPDPPATPGADFRVPDLAPLEARYVPERPRRVGRHARLTLVGAAACVAEAPAPIPGNRTGIYLGSGIGNAAEESLVVEQVVGMVAGVTPGPASPVHFANSVSNSATFYAARVTGATGPNVVVSQEEVSFEGALMAADLALRAGEIDCALVGGVDEYLVAREGTFLRIDLPADTVLGEGSGWLLVARDAPGVAGAPGEILASVQVPGGIRAGADAPDAWEQVAAIATAARWNGEAVTILPGVRVDAADAAALAACLPGARVNTYLDRCGTFATAAALGIAGCFRPDATAGLYVHVSRCRLGVAAVVLRRTPLEWPEATPAPARVSPGNPSPAPTCSGGKEGSRPCG